MKTKLKLAVLALFLSTVNAQFSTCFAQGSLTPPGAPAASMKTLAQIEPRTPISSAPFTISSSGSYYLTTNLTVATGDAINITVNGVTLDLNGFTISSTAPSATGTAILFGGPRSNVAIYNGHIISGVTNTAAGVFSGAGFGYGITSSGSSNLRVKDLSVAGVLFYGINLGVSSSTVVEGCAVNVAGSYGIIATSVSDSTAMNCGSVGINANTMHNCTGQGVGSGTGLSGAIINNGYGTSSGSGYGLQANSANNCYGTSSSGYGLSATTANNCSGTSSSGTGLNATSVNNCYGTSSTANGLSATTANNCYGSSSSGVGLFAQVITGCYGTSTSNTGLMAGSTATSCFGSSSSSTGIAVLGNGVSAYCCGVSYNGSSSLAPGIVSSISIGCVGFGNPAISSVKYLTTY